MYRPHACQQMRVLYGLVHGICPQKESHFDVLDCVQRPLLKGKQMGSKWTRYQYVSMDVDSTCEPFIVNLHMLHFFLGVAYK